MTFRAKILKTALLTGVLVACGADTGMANTHGPNIVVIGGEASDPFFAVVKRGAETAGLLLKSQGGSMTWLGLQSYDNLGPDVAKLIRTALSRKPSAIAAPDWVPEAEDPAFRAVVAAHVPLIVYNAGGMNAAMHVHAMNYVGSDDYLAGFAAGEYFGRHKINTVLCVNTVPGAANLEAECKGVKDGIAKEGGQSTELRLPPTSFGNPTAVAQAVKAALLQHAGVDGVYTIGSADANSAATAITQASARNKVKLGSLDIDQTILGRIKNGSQMFAIDQEPYMQGFLTVSLLNAYVSYGLDIPTRPILTGPVVIDLSNVDVTLAGAKAGVR